MIVKKVLSLLPPPNLIYIRGPYALSRREKNGHRGNVLLLGSKADVSYQCLSVSTIRHFISALYKHAEYIQMNILLLILRTVCVGLSDKDIFFVKF